MSDEILTTGWLPITEDFAPMVNTSGDVQDNQFFQGGNNLGGSGYSTTTSNLLFGGVLTLGFGYLNIQEEDTVLVSVDLQSECKYEGDISFYFLGVGLNNSYQGSNRYTLDPNTDKVQFRSRKGDRKVTSYVAEDDLDVQEKWWPAAQGHNGGFIGPAFLEMKPAIAVLFMGGAGVRTSWHASYTKVRFNYKLGGARNLFVREKDVWKPVEEHLVKDGGVWKPAAVNIRNSGVWKEVYS